MRKKYFKNLFIILALFAYLASNAEKVDSINKKTIDSLNVALSKEIVDSTKIKILFQICEVYGYYDTQTLILANQAMQLAISTNDVFNEAKAHFIIGNYYYYNRFFQLSINHFLSANELFASIKMPSQQLNCIHLLGILHRRINKLQEAIEYHFESLKIAEQLGNKGKISAAYFSIGDVYYIMEQWDKCLEYYDKSLQIDLELNDSSGIASNYLNMGIVNTHIKNKSIEALQYYNRALNIYRHIGNDDGVSMVLNNIGIVYLDLEEYDKALKYLFESYEMDKKAGKIEGIAYSLNSIGDVYFKMGLYHKAIEYQFQALEMTKELYLKQIIFKSLSEIYEKMKDFKNSLQYFKLHTALKDSVFTESNTEIINNLSLQYQTEKREKELELKNVIIHKNNERMRRQKTVILFSIAFILILFIGIWFFRREYKVKKRANSILELQNREIIQQKEEIQSQRDELEILNAELKQKNEEITAQRDEINEKSNIIELKSRNITDSILYAGRIQKAILPPKDLLDKVIPNRMIIYQPCQIIGGDFYWVNLIQQYTYIAVADCTGHGVPGAFMSMLGITQLNEVINKYNVLEPAQILNQIRDSIKKSLHQTNDDSLQKDGMDIAICAIDSEKNVLKFAGAYISLYLFRNNQMQVLSADRMPVAVYADEQPFTQHVIQLQKDDIFYLFTDGYNSQFGGKYGHKFLSKKFIELLQQIHTFPLDKQKELLIEKHNDWKNDYEQVDDITIVAIQV